MNKKLTIVLVCYFSHRIINKVLKTLKQYKVIIIENSLDARFKKDLEKKYNNVEVIIPNRNIGLAKGYNLGIKLARTKYVFLNCPDFEISHQDMNQLILYANTIKKFGIISPIYAEEKNFRNYGGEKSIKQESSSFYQKNKILAVNWIDNSFVVNKKQIKNNLFDENYFLWFETIDFCLNLRRNNFKLFITRKIKFKHYGSKSTDQKFDKIVSLTRAWHYNWSKFYYYRKNYDYIFALTKIFPNFIKALKKFTISLFKFNKFGIYLALIELYGIVSSILCLKSFYRPQIK